MLSLFERYCQRTILGVESQFVKRHQPSIHGRKKGTLKAKPERAWTMKDQGMNQAEIARALGVTPQSVWRYLKMRPKWPVHKNGAHVVLDMSTNVV